MTTAYLTDGPHAGALVEVPDRYDMLMPPARLLVGGVVYWRAELAKPRRNDVDPWRYYCADEVPNGGYGAWVCPDVTQGR